MQSSEYCQMSQCIDCGWDGLDCDGLLFEGKFIGYYGQVKKDFQRKVNQKYNLWYYNSTGLSSW